jgi:hypothetical protein
VSCGRPFSSRMHSSRLTYAEVFFLLLTCTFFFFFCVFILSKNGFLPVNFSMSPFLFRFLLLYNYNSSSHLIIRSQKRRISAIWLSLTITCDARLKTSEPRRATLPRNCCIAWRLWRAAMRLVGLLLLLLLLRRHGTS